MLQRGLDGLYRVAGWLAGLFMLAILVLMMLLSVGRILRFNIPSGDDFTAWSMAAMAFLGLAHTFKAGDMIRVGLLLERLHGRVRHGFELVALTIAAAFALYFTWHVFGLVRFSWRLNDQSTGVVSVPLWIPQSGLLLGLVILSVAMLDELSRLLRGLPPSYEKAPAATPEELVNRIADGSV